MPFLGQTSMVLSDGGAESDVSSSSHGQGSRFRRSSRGLLQASSSYDGVRAPSLKRQIEDGGLTDGIQSPSDSGHEASLELSDRPKKVIRRTVSHIDVTEPAYPRSSYEGWEPPLDQSTEEDAISDLYSEFNGLSLTGTERPEYTYFALDDFTIYNTQSSRHSLEMATLDRLQNRIGHDEYQFDGILSVGEKRRYVQGVRFRIMAVDGYGEDVASLHDQICIQSPRSTANDIWYRLGAPSKVYERFYNPFMWLAHFTKHFVDYLLETKKVTLHHFRTRFSQWLCSKYGENTEFQKWLSECNHVDDFRTTVAAHIGYLWKESHSIDDAKTGLCKHPIWGETNPYGLTAIPEEENRESKTIVTPFAYDCFKRMYFKEHLEVRAVSDHEVLHAIGERKRSLGLTPSGARQPAEANVPTPLSMPFTDDEIIDVRVGDVVCILADQEGPWQVTSPTWYAYVQDTRQLQNGQTRLDIIWLYEPSDTTFGAAYYPFKNELFMSDNCECGTHALDLASVIGKADVTWFEKDPSDQSGLFVRQKFRTIREEDTYDFVTLEESDFRCSCSKRVPIFEECRTQYSIGDTVLVRHWNPSLGEDSLEPAQIVDFNLKSQVVALRQFQRTRNFDLRARPNELMLSDETFSKPPSAIIRKCFVRFFSQAQTRKGLPTPYDRDGTGDFFFVIQERSGLSGSNGAVDHIMASSSSHAKDASTAIMQFPSIQVGPDFSSPPNFEKLKGMGIFCGGGNFDRGFEDAGVVDFRYAVDWAYHAIHSYRANVEDPSKVHFFLGSVNDYLAEAIAGSKYINISGVGDVGFISAGSPCPGFSTLQPNKQSPDSLRNASLVASVVSFVDFYCPKYLVLENVVNMTLGMGANKNENVFAQILAALVAMGYQTQQFLMDAWNYGSSQSRYRVFIVASAPGLKPLPQPQHSHAHPAVVMDKALGKSSNGLRFGIRRHDYTPFPHVSPAQATVDLPNIGDSQPQICPTFPDHRTPSEEVAKTRARISAVPVYPQGMSLVQAALAGKLSGEPLDYYNGLTAYRKAAGSKGYSRVHRDGLFPTVTTTLNIHCAFSGRTLHWTQPRCLTVMELKRAQGFLDSDVLIGTPRTQVHIIGNSVDRHVALALGLSLKNSWSKSNRPDDALLHWEETDFMRTPSSATPASLTDNGMHAHPMSALDGVESSRKGNASRTVDRWQPDFKSPQPQEDGDGRIDQNEPGQQTCHRYRLSQEEMVQIQADPRHGFKIINQILEKNGSQPRRASC